MNHAIEILTFQLQRNELSLHKLRLFQNPPKAWRRATARAERQKIELERAIRILTAVED
jgi:hypothetical protein